jgi:hypothetical protein
MEQSVRNAVASPSTAHAATRQCGSARPACAIDEKPCSSLARCPRCNAVTDASEVMHRGMEVWSKQAKALRNLHLALRGRSRIVWVDVCKHAQQDDA